MKMPWLVAALVAVATPVLAAGPAPVTGEYVEARTAEVFTGGCIMSSEAETIGRQAVMAWHINHGAFNGVTLDGLSVIAAVAGDRNLGIREIGGGAPTAVRAAIIVDSRATTAQRDAHRVRPTDFRRLIEEIINVSAAPVTFESDGHEVGRGRRASSPRRVTTHPSCGAMQWFHPLAAVSRVHGLTAVGTFSPHAPMRWSDPSRRSGLIGTFTLSRSGYFQT